MASFYLHKNYILCVLIWATRIKFCERGSESRDNEYLPKVCKSRSSFGSEVDKEIHKTRKLFESIF